MITKERFQMCSPCLEPILADIPNSIPIDDPDFEDYDEEWGPAEEQDEEDEDEDVQIFD